MYKVFYNDHQIILTESVKYVKDTYLAQKHEIAILSELPNRIRKLRKSQDPKLIICFVKPKKGLIYLYKSFQERKAAGGIVVKKNKKILMIFRRGKWDLPKGHLERKESFEEAAEREIQEETGIDRIKLISNLIPTYHIYSYKGKLVIKHVEWYLFKTKSKIELVPQEKEDITKVKWVKIKKLKKYKKNTFASINEVIHSYLAERSDD